VEIASDATRGARSVAGDSQASPTLDPCTGVRRSVLEWEGSVVEGAALYKGVAGQVIA